VQLRYVAFLWNPEHAAAAAAAKFLKERSARSSFDTSRQLAKPGLHIIYSSGDASIQPWCPLAGGKGIIVGRLFECMGKPDAGPPNPVAALAERETESVIRSSGRYLVEHYWGSYVAFLSDPANRRQWVLRAPMAQLPCFRTAWRGVQIFFSRMEDCLALGGPTFSFNWSYIATHVAFNAVKSTATALNEVEEVKVGQCIEVAPERTAASFYWNPCTIAKSASLEDPMEAATLLRATALACTRAWTRSHQDVLVTLSGGLDSSIILSCLAEAADRPRITALNRYSIGSNGDERRFARSVAAKSRCALVEQQRTVDVRLEDMLGAARTALLYGYTNELIHAKPVNEFAVRHGMTAVVTGNGGDCIFHRRPALPAVVDFVRRHGLRTSLVELTLDVARLEHLSVWNVLRQTLGEILFKTAKRPWFHDVDSLWVERGKAVVNKEAIAYAMGAASFDHPWFDSAAGVPQGKLWQISGLAFRANDDPFLSREHPEIVNPLLSQPMVELCLRIPTYLHLHGGRDRGLARRAFAGLVPDDILKRTAKGGVEEYGKAIVGNNMKFVRERLLDGVLVQHKLIHRDLLADALSGKPSTSYLSFGDLLAHLSTEVWLTLWSDHKSAAAA